MQRVLIAALAAVDALVAAAAGIAVVLAPLTLLWLASFGGDPVWEALWPATARIWQLGHLVPLEVSLDAEALVATGVADDAASFVVSLAPLAFASFTFLFAWRSGRRAQNAGAGLTGAAAGAVTTAVVAWVALATSANPVVGVSTWPAILLPAAVYAAGAIGGSLAAGWEADDDGAIAWLRDRAGGRSVLWRDVVRHIATGTKVVIVGVIGVAALLFAVLLVTRGSEVIVLFERAGVDAVGATAVTLGHLAYLPTLLGWALAWVAGPGFALGEGTSVSPSGTSLGVVPGVPILGLIPEGGTGWLLLIVLVPVGLGAVAGWIARRGFADAAYARGAEGEEPYAPRAVVAVGIGVCSGLVGALMTALSAGSIGPGRMAETGGDPGAVALALGLEALVGAAILLLAPMRRVEAEDVHHDDRSTLPE